MNQGQERWYCSRGEECTNDGKGYHPTMREARVCMGDTAPPGFESLLENQTVHATITKP